MIRRDGAVAPEPAARGRLTPHAGRYELSVDAPGLLVLQEESAPGHPRDRVLMAGEIVSRMTVVEVCNIVASTNWRGELLVVDPEGGRRGLTFDQGALKLAESSLPQDRLAEVLHRHGWLDRPTLEVLRQETGDDDRALALICVERGLLDREGLFASLRRQAEDIFYGSLLVGDGTYVFRQGERADDRGAAAATLHVPVQALLMEGVQRIDEMALFRQRIPGPEMVPELKADAPGRAGGRRGGSQEPTLAKVLGWVDGRRSIGEIARGTGLGEFGATKAIYQLLQQGTVVLHRPRNIDEAATRRLVRQINEVVRDVFVAVATYGGIDATRATLAAWIQGSGYDALFGDGVDVDGSLDADDVVRRLQSSPEPHPLEHLHQALHELAAFTLFSASTSLPRDQELRLSRDVNRRLQAIRL